MPVVLSKKVLEIENKGLGFKLKTAYNAVHVFLLFAIPGLNMGLTIYAIGSTKIVYLIIIFALVYLFLILEMVFQFRKREKSIVLILAAISMMLFFILTTIFMFYKF
jgi:hypothetical protein